MTDKPTDDLTAAERAALEASRKSKVVIEETRICVAIFEAEQSWWLWRISSGVCEVDANLAGKYLVEKVVKKGDDFEATLDDQSTFVFKGTDMFLVKWLERDPEPRLISPYQMQHGAYKATRCYFNGHIYTEVLSVGEAPDGFDDDFMMVRCIAGNYVVRGEKECLEALDEDIAIADPQPEAGGGVKRWDDLTAAQKERLVAISRGEQLDNLSQEYLDLVELKLVQWFINFEADNIDYLTPLGGQLIAEMYARLEAQVASQQRELDALRGLAGAGDDDDYSGAIGGGVGL